jgi:hypothetical protein
MTALNKWADLLEADRERKEAGNIRSKTIAFDGFPVTER